MSLSKNTLQRILFWLSIAVVDMAVFILLGILLMAYEDSWDISKGAYWSLASMNTKEKLIYFSFCAWQVINVIALLYIGWKIFICFKHKI